MSQTAATVVGMIDLGSIAGLHAHNHQLHAYCPRCDRWAVLPLAAMIATGQGSRRLPFTVRCRWCGATGRLQVRRPAPTRGPGGWMEPPTTSSCRPPPSPPQAAA